MQNFLRSHDGGKNQTHEGTDKDESKDSQRPLPSNVQGQASDGGGDAYLQMLMKELSSLQVDGQQPHDPSKGWYQGGVYDGVYNPTANMGLSQHVQPHVDPSASYAQLSGGQMPPHQFPMDTPHRESLETVMSTSSVHSDRLSQNAAYGQSVLQPQVPYQNFQALHTEVPVGPMQHQNMGMNRSSTPQNYGYSQGSNHKGSGPRIFCGHVPKEVTEDLVKAHFSQWGTVTDVYFPRHKKTLKRRPFCFVTFGNIECANKALQESPLNICGIPIKNMTMVEDRDKYYHEKHARVRETLASVLKASPIIAGSNLTQEQVDNIAALLAMDGASAETVLNSLGFQQDQVAKHAPPQDNSNVLLHKLHDMTTMAGLDGRAGPSSNWPPMRSSLDAQGGYPAMLSGIVNASHPHANPNQVSGRAAFPELSNDAAIQNALRIALGNQQAGPSAGSGMIQGTQQQMPEQGTSRNAGLQKHPQFSNASLPANPRQTAENSWMEPDSKDEMTQNPNTVRKSI